MVTNNLPCPGLPGITSSVNGINFSNSCNENEGIATNSRGLMVPVGMPFLSGLTPEQPYYPGHPYANSMYGNYDFSGYPMLRNGYGMDLNGSRRKNATRETTSTLKAWLNDHMKNPYPTKAEKIMLAIITQMTLTQVSTWFANARRRLKKENKMTWSPRNRCDDDDDDDDFKESGFNSLTDTRDVDGTPLGSVNHYRRRLKRENRMTYSPSPTPTLSSSSTTIPTLDQTNAPSPPTSKPRIWSIVDLATSNTSNS